jgi:hypothetical protein
MDGCENGMSHLPHRITRIIEIAVFYKLPIPKILRKLVLYMKHRDAGGLSPFTE